MNTEGTELPAPPVAREKTVSLRPTFFGALRGVWLFTWKSQLTWRRVPILLISLLALPLLVYISISLSGVQNVDSLTSLRWGRSTTFCRWLIGFYFFMILPLNCVRTCGGLIRDELQADTLSFLTTRPLSRARLMAIKYLCQTGWLQIVMLIETLLLFAVGHLMHIPALGALIPVFLATQFLAVLAWSALGTLLGQVTKRYMALAMVYGLIVEMGIGSIPTNINTLSLMRHLKTLLAHNAALQNIYEWSVNRIPVSMGALALATGIFLSLAMLLFTFKEYHHTVEMQK